MKVFIVGGSNSFSRKGWTPNFIQNCRDHKVINLAVGSAATAMGLYRMLDCDDMKSGDVIIWEYSGNETTQIELKRDPNSINQFREHLIRLCQRRGLKLIMFVQNNRQIEASGIRPPTYDHLFRLINHYSLVYYDLSQAWRDSHGGNRIPAERYSDAHHYIFDDEMNKLVTDGLLALLPKATRPTKRAPLYVPVGSRLVLEKPVDGIPLANSSLSLSLADPSRPEHIIRHNGRILAFFAAHYRLEQAGLEITLEHDKHSSFTTRVSTGLRKSGVPWEFKHLILQDICGSYWRCYRGDKLRVAPIVTASECWAFFGSIPKVSEPHLPPRPTFAGLLIETNVPGDNANNAAPRTARVQAGAPAVAARLRRNLSRLKRILLRQFK